MKKTLLYAATLLCATTYAQEHFSGLSTSRRGGIINATVNPAELLNIKDKYDINVFSISTNVSNNKITFGDIVEGDNLEELIFTGTEPVNMRANSEILGPSFAMKIDKWAFGIASAAKLSVSMVDIDVNLGDALVNSGVTSLLLGTPIQTDYNQRAVATSWGEIGFSGAREIYNEDRHRVTSGATFKLLFPGSYANMSADKFNGRIVYIGNQVGLTDATATVNFAYSGSLANGFNDTGNYTDFFAGGLNGFAVDFGANYQWLKEDGEGYKINAGLALRNLGSMKFKDDNNVNNTYRLDVPEGAFMNLNAFEDVESVEEAEEVLLASGYATIEEASKDFKVKLPGLFNAYADFNIYNKWYVTGYWQQKLTNDNNNDQIALQNTVTLTPRYSTNWFEAYTPLSHNEVAGFTAGIGFRIGGFFLGSGSILSAAIGDTNQADAYFGFRLGF